MESIIMAVKDWSPIVKKYGGKWIALKDDEVTVIAAGDTLKEARAQAEKAGFPHPIFTKIPAKLTYFAG
jgi:hypothetical protein